MNKISAWPLGRENDSGMQLTHLLAYHRLLMHVPFAKVLAAAIGVLLGFGALMTVAGIYTGKAGVAHAGSVFALVSIGFMALCTLNAAGQVASQMPHRLTPHVERAAHVYLFGLWWLQVGLGTWLALALGLPPIFGILTGLLYALFGNAFGIKGLDQFVTSIALIGVIVSLDPSAYLTHLPVAAMAVLYFAGLTLAAIHARAAVRRTLDSRSHDTLVPPVAFINALGFNNFSSAIRTTSPAQLVSAGLGPLFHIWHRSVLIASLAPIGMSWLFSPTAREHFAFLGAFSGLLVVGYLVSVWYVYSADTGGKSLMMLTPTLPRSAEWNRALGGLLMRRAASIGMVSVVLVAASGVVRYGQFPNLAWWLASAGAPLLAALAAFGNYHGPLRRRSAVLGVAGMAAFMAQAVLFMKLDPFLS